VPAVLFFTPRFLPRWLRLTKIVIAIEKRKLQNNRQLTTCGELVGDEAGQMSGGMAVPSGWKRFRRVEAWACQGGLGR
jgi:hypothetical protein